MHCVQNIANNNQTVFGSICVYSNIHVVELQNNVNLNKIRRQLRRFCVDSDVFAVLYQCCYMPNLIVVCTCITGIGIDDMFILLSGLSGAQGEATIEDKMAATLRASGVGITITSLTDLIAFMAGAASNFIAVRNFCIYTGKL